MLQRAVSADCVVSAALRMWMDGWMDGCWLCTHVGRNLLDDCTTHTFKHVHTIALQHSSTQVL